MSSQIRSNEIRNIDLLAGREFQLWHYTVSHGGLLIRSPANTGKNLIKNVDVVFWGVTYLRIARILGNITIEQIDFETATAGAPEIMPLQMETERAWRINSKKGSHLVVAISIKIGESELALMESPLEIK